MEKILIEVDPFLTNTIAILVLFVGKLLTMRSALLRKYSIPEPLAGGLLFSIATAVLYYQFDRVVMLDTGERDHLLLIFFAALGLNSKISTLIAGGRPLVILIVLAAVFIVLQNLTGITVASLWGLEPQVGLLSGSVSLTGGVGTTVAWAPTFIEDFGIENAMEIGVACNTAGLILACLMGGPIAQQLISRHRLETGNLDDVSVGVANEERPHKLDYLAFLFVLMNVNIAIIIGHFINLGIESLGLQLPAFVSCLIAGILMRNTIPFIFPRYSWPGAAEGLALISDIALGMFLTITLMGMQLWALAGVLGYVVVVITAQALLSILFTLFVVFRFMGRDYEAAVMCSGFGGITLGSTATAIVNMTAVSHQYGAAPRAFIIVPLVCGFFIDLVNAFAINFFLSL